MLPKKGKNGGQEKTSLPEIMLVLEQLPTKINKSSIIQKTNLRNTTNEIKRAVERLGCVNRYW
jgi:hypothetical protein